MRLFRGYLVAAVLACMTMLSIPAVATASPLGVGAYSGSVGSAVNAARDLNDRLDVLAAILPAEARVAPRDDASLFGRARRDANTVASVMLNCSTALIAASPLEVGARLAGSVRAAG